MLTLLNKITKLYSIKLLTRGRGIKEVQKYADVICEKSLMYLNIIEEWGLIKRSYQRTCIISFPTLNWVGVEGGGSTIFWHLEGGKVVSDVLGNMQLLNF